MKRLCACVALSQGVDFFLASSAAKCFAVKDQRCFAESLFITSMW